LLYAIGAIQWSNSRRIKSLWAVCSKLIFVLHCILDAKYEAADLDEVIRACDHLDADEQSQLQALLHKYEHLFNGTLGTWNDEPYNIELKEGAKPYHSKATFSNSQSS